MEDIIEQFLRKVSYKFPKGYPDINDPKDVLMLEGMLKEIGITLPEANLGGTATGYGGQYGAFKKYVTDNNKHIVGNPNDIKYKAEKNTVLLDSDFNPSKEIKKGDEFNILIKDTKELVKKGSSSYAKISFNNEEFYIRITDILKPTGKQVEKYAPDLNTAKSDPSVYHPFTPGHRQEKQVAELFINKSNKNWGLKYLNKYYTITYLGGPEKDWSANTTPKSDVQVSFNKTPRPDIGSKFQISLKASNADNVESWITPIRALQIFDKDVLKKEVLDILASANRGTLFAKGTSATAYLAFMATPKQTYKIDTGTETRGPLKLSKEGKIEAYTGSKKFGANSTGRANCFFKGEVPNTIEEFINQLKTLEGNIDEFEDLYLRVRGSNEKRKAVVFTKVEKEDGSFEYKINDIWKSALGL